MSSKNGVACPSCGADNVNCLGAISASNSFAGRHLEQELPGGKLWCCNACHLFFRFPRLTKEKLDELYREGHSESWSGHAQDRIDWHLVKSTLSERPDIRRVLDVGCFDGRLLDSLGTHYEKMGVEIHAEAARRAALLNVKIIGRDFGELRVDQNGVDAVLAMDVIEHAEDPLAFLARLADVLKPGGLILIGTGNSESPSWRFMGSAYWYCHIAEHISFINPSWTGYAAKQFRLEVESLRFFSHIEGNASIKQRVYEASANLLLRFAPKLFALMRRCGAGGIDLARYPGLALAPPYWMSAKDHMLVVFKKT